ncbi:MAG TPA: wax ester/triacylglycerol synthase family O-acyltransferase [Acidimicrobiales bacterium]|nr:wax ester/triacylglycerol synthase family O-acyltransferase [Acidimicrobiales bacterium]
MTASEPLTGLDALFLFLESPRTPMHAASIAIFEGAPFKDGRGAVRIDALRREIGHRLDLVPKLRRRVRFPRFGQAMPVWVDDVDFDVNRHVRHVALPVPGTEAQLTELSAALLSVPIDRAHPLWELWIVEGLTGGRVALVEKVHHALADGLASVELATVLLDFERDVPPPVSPASSWCPRPEPREATVVVSDIAHRGLRSVHAGRSAWAAIEHPARSARKATDLAVALRTLATARSVAPRSSINGPVGQSRRVALIRQPLDQVRRVESRFGVTVNDVLLAAVAGGLRAQLTGRGEPVDGVTLQALIPVGLDSHEDHRLGNKVSAMLVRLPVGMASPLDRLMSVTRGMNRCKEHRQALAGEYITRLIDGWPRSALAGAARLVHHQPFVNLVITNVPGPSVPLYCMGARMLEAFPIVPLAGNLSVGVAAFTYDGQLSVGLLADGDRCPDVGVLADGIRASFVELVAAATAGDERVGADPEKPKGPCRVQGKKSLSSAARSEGAHTR